MSTAKSSSSSSSYTPGMYDHLLAPHDHARPEELRGVTIEISASGRSVVLAEHLRTGNGQRSLIDLDDPAPIFLILADGRELWIELRAIEVPAEDREPWLSSMAAPISTEPAGLLSRWLAKTLAKPFQPPPLVQPIFRALSFTRPVGGSGR